MVLRSFGEPREIMGTGNINPSVLDSTSLQGVDANEPIQATRTRPRLEFGTVDDKVMVPVELIIDLRQTREVYDPDALKELEQSIPIKEEDDDRILFKLMHPVYLARLDREHLEIYLEDHKQYFRGEVEAIDIDMLPQENGYYYVRISGHRRGRAIQGIAEEIGGYSEDEDTVYSSIEHNPKFEDTIPLQYVENRTSSISAVEDAKAIERHYLWIKDTQQGARGNLVQELRGVFGFKEDKIRDALRFVTAPEAIQAFVGKGLSYSNVISLVRLRDAYVKSLNARYSEERDEVLLSKVRDEAAGRMEDYFERTLKERLRGKTARHIGEMIEGKIKEVLKTAEYITGELFVFDTETNRKEAKDRTHRQIGSMAIATIQYLKNQNALSVEQLEEIATLLAAPRIAAVPNASQDNLFD